MTVSVCIPVYKVESCVERCARSLFEQTMKDDIEFVFVDDCSPDGSIDVIKRVLKDYPERCGQVRFLRNEVNLGQALTRCAAIREAKGEYVICCDADDWVETELYETMSARARTDNADVVCCPICEEDDRKKEFSRHDVDVKDVCEFFERHFYGVYFNGVCNKLFRTEILSGDFILPEHACICEDLLYVSQCLAKIKNISFVHDVTYHYVRRASSMSGSAHFSLADRKMIVSGLQNALQQRYRRCITYFIHVMLLDICKRPGTTAAQYHELWRSERTVRSILGDERISFGKRFVLLVANIAFPMVNVIDSIRYRIKMGR